MITDHRYQSSYAGIDPERQRCTFAYIDAPRCEKLPAEHADTVAPREAHADQTFDIINKARHYNSHPSGIEAIEIARYLSGDWFNAFKYVFRAEHKNGRQDVEKAIYYAEDSIAHQVPMFGYGWCRTQHDLLTTVINFERGCRRAFFASVRLGNRHEALGALKHVLLEMD